MAINIFSFFPHKSSSCCSKGLRFRNPPLNLSRSTRLVGNLNCCVHTFDKGCSWFASVHLKENSDQGENHCTDQYNALIWHFYAMLRWVDDYCYKMAGGYGWVIGGATLYGFRLSSSMLSYCICWTFNLGIFATFKYMSESWWSSKGPCCFERFELGVWCLGLVQSESP